MTGSIGFLDASQENLSGRMADEALVELEEISLAIIEAALELEDEGQTQGPAASIEPPEGAASADQARPAPGPAALPAQLIAPAVPHGATFHLNLRTSGPRSAALPVQASMVHPQSCETCDSARFSWPGEYRAPLVEGLLRKSDGAPGPLAAVDRERIDFAILALARSLQLAYSPGQVAGQPRFIVLPPVLDTDVNLPANLPLSIVLSPYHLAKVQKELRRRRLSDLPEPVRDHIHIMIPRQPRSSWPESRDSRVAQSQAVDGSCTPTKCLCWCCIDWFRGEDPYRGFVCTCLFFVVFLIVLFVLQVFERYDANDSDSTLSSA